MNEKLMKSCEVNGILQETFDLCKLDFKNNLTLFCLSLIHVTLPWLGSSSKIRQVQFFISHALESITIFDQF